MFFRPYYRFESGCAAYVFGCGGKGLAGEGMAEIMRWNQGRA